jgi:hypothetical protein
MEVLHPPCRPLAPTNHQRQLVRIEIFEGDIIADIFTTNLPSAYEYVASASEAAVVVCGCLHPLDKFLDIASRLPALKDLVIYNAEVIASLSCSVPVYAV